MKTPRYKRQKFLLAWIESKNSIMSLSEIQNGIYHDPFFEAYYHFLPYLQGPFSFELENDLNKLYINNFIYIIEDQISLKNFEESYSDELSTLDYSVNLNPIPITNKSSKNPEITLFTIGYEGKSIEEYFNSLLENNIDYLIDVRKNPISRKFGFSKKKLSSICNTLDIQYHHYPQLGIESKLRNENTDFIKLFEDYRKDLPFHSFELNCLSELLKNNNRIALTCFEANPKDCHRSIIRDCLATMNNINFIDL